MATKRRDHKSWMCRNNHPLVGKNRRGEPYCLMCAKMNRFVSSVGTVKCSSGHVRLATTRRCTMCDIYRQTPWLRRLDRDGEALCPAGHEVSHRVSGTVLYYRDGRRLCAACRAPQLLAARLTRIEPSERVVCRRGLHAWPEHEGKPGPTGKRRCLGCAREARVRRYWKIQMGIEASAGLAPDWVDWAVVHRAMIGTPDEKLYDLARGGFRGMTPGEKWVAYCTYRAQYGQPGDGHSPASREDKFHRWYEETVGYKFKTVTLSEILADLPSAKYRLNRML